MDYKMIWNQHKKVMIGIVALVIVIVFLTWKMIVSSHASAAHKAKGVASIITVQKKPSTTMVYFSGIVKPISVTPVPSPVEGVIVKQLFNFGDFVKKDQLLFILSSRTEHSTLQTAVSAYFTAKHNLNKDKLQLEQTEMLYKQGLESKNSYQTVKDTYFADELAVLQAESQLKAIKYLPFEQISHLTATNVDEVRRFIGGPNAADEIRVNAPVDGVALFVKSNDQSSLSDSEIPANHIKDGDVLTTIGDTSGLSINIKVDELNLPQIRTNQKAIITCAAAKSITLPGYISNVNTQASSDSENGVPSFSAKVTVPALTPEQQKMIHVGMSAKIAVEIPREPQILIPLDAVLHENDQSYVEKINPKNGKRMRQDIITGDTKLSSIVVLSGLSEGDKIVVFTNS